MGLTKDYLRFVPDGTLGLISSPRSNILWITYNGITGRYVAVGAAECVFVWDTRSCTEVRRLADGPGEVSRLAADDKDHLAVGYSDGSVRLYSIETDELLVTFHGHKSAVTSLCFHTNLQLSSASLDTNIIVWDIVALTGLYKLRGHKGAVTHLQYMCSRNVLISSSKDSFIKFWDLDVQHCFSTLVGHSNEIWSFCLLCDETLLVSGSSDSKLSLWSLDFPDQHDKSRDPTPTEGDGGGVSSSHGDRVVARLSGDLHRIGTDRLLTLSVDSTGRYLLCHGRKSAIEIFKVLNEEETAKRVKKRKKKMLNRDEVVNGSGPDGGDDFPATLRIDPVCRVKEDVCFRSCDGFLTERGFRLVASTTSNEIVIRIVSSAGQLSEETVRISRPGHRTDIRAVCFTSDASAVVSCSGDSVKLWNRGTGRCFRSIRSGYVTSCLVVPGDDQLIVGTRSGALLSYNLGTGDLVGTLDPPHSDSVWSLVHRPDSLGFYSGSADKQVRYWEYVSGGYSDSSTAQLQAVHRRTLELPDEVMNLRATPNGRLIAVALLDATIRVFYADSFKFFLSLYGHKLPVLCMDVSADSGVLVSGSADKNIKFWGLDFGECRGSVFAHDDSITEVRFLGETRTLMSCGRDGVVKRWDGDGRTLIGSVADGAAALCMCASTEGDRVAVGRRDGSLRLYRESDEILVVSEEPRWEESVAPPVVPGEADSEAVPAGGRSMDALDAAERIIGAVDLHNELRSSGKPEEIAAHPLIKAYKCSDSAEYVVEILRKIRSCDLDQGLLFLPFDYVLELLPVLESRIAATPIHLELCLRCVLFLVRANHRRLVGSLAALPVMSLLRGRVSAAQEYRDSVGFNLEGLRFLHRRLEATKELTLFADATQRRKEKNKKQRVTGRKILAIR